MKTSFHALTAALALAVIAFTPGRVLAEGSERDTPPEQQEIARAETIPKEAQAWIDYLQDLDRRYPDSGEVNIEAFLAEEGETAALLYCRAIGFDGPCTIENREDGQRFVAATDGKGVVKASWSSWLWDHLFNVGVIPEREPCPASFAMVTIHMDDEDNNNGNNRGGWLGATVSNTNTTWRFCRLDLFSSLNFRPLPIAGNQYDYAVLSLGLFCPSGGRRVIRHQDNEDWANGNYSVGDVFPNFNAWPGNWITMTCHFDGAAASWAGSMAAFPNLGMKYGVYAPLSMPAAYAVAHGWVHQDDEDFLNTNYWMWQPDWVMSGGVNTTRNLAKVQ